jgi:calcineurin-like phosphoesterase family protein
MITSDFFDFFASDPHWYHANIIKYSNRPFADAGHMSEALVSNWNSVVSPNDKVLLFGDVCFGNIDKSIEYLWRLNGTICLLRGNHDDKSMGRKRFTDRFAWIKDYYEYTVKIGTKDQLIVCMHYPIASWRGAHRGSWMLHGHSHHSYHPGLPSTLDCGKILDVGVDGRGYNYSPISFNHVSKIMEKKIFKRVDGHEAHHNSEMDV